MNQGQSLATSTSTEPFIAAHNPFNNPAHNPVFSDSATDSATMSLASQLTESSDVEVDSAADTNLEKNNPLQRRNFLRSGFMATAMTLTSLLGARGAAAQAEQPESTASSPAMRSPRNQLVTAAGGTTPIFPPLSIITLNRMAFGPRPGDLDAFNALGNTPEAALQAYVEQQLNPAGINDSVCDAVIAGYAFQTLGKGREQLWAEHVKDDKTYDRYQPLKEVRNVTFLRAIYSKRQLSEVLADFWHNHFNVYAWDYWAAPMWVHYDRDVIRGNMLGNFRKMLEDVATSVPMLYYLDNQSSTGGNPNENFTRELFELHTMGSENYMGVVPLLAGGVHPAPKDVNGKPLLYVDADVYGGTTCFTGWRVDEATGLFKFDASVHFPYSKLVLGNYIADGQGVNDGKTVLDLLARHPGTARFIARKLCRRLISDNPPASVVQAAADVFMANLDAPDQLQKVTRTILLSPEFRATWGQKVKRPYEYAMAALRAVEVDYAPVDWFFWVYDNMGQALFEWHPPNGYPDVRFVWTSTMPMLQRWRMINWMMEWTYGGEGANKDEKRVKFNQPAGLLKPKAIVDYWSTRLLGYVLPDNERNAISEFLAYGRNVEYDLPSDQIDERLRYMVDLILMTPSFQYR